MKQDSLNNSLPEDQLSLENKSFQKISTPIYANVYNFSSCFNSFCSCCNLGLYHTGIQLYGHQYMFYGFDGDESGVCYIQPRGAAYQFSEQILLGHTQYTYYQIQQHILQPLMLEFRGMQSFALSRNIQRKEIDTTSYSSTATISPSDQSACCNSNTPSPTKYSPSPTASTTSAAAYPTASSTADWTGLTGETTTIVTKKSTQSSTILVSLESLDNDHIQTFCLRYFNHNILGFYYIENIYHGLHIAPLFTRYFSRLRMAFLIQSLLRMLQEHSRLIDLAYQLKGFE